MDLGIVEIVGDVDLVEVRVDEAALGGVEVQEVVAEEGLLLHQGVVGDASLAAEDGLVLERTGQVFAGGEGLGLEAVVFVPDRDFFLGLDGPVHAVAPEAGHVDLVEVAVRCGALFVKDGDAPGALEAGVDELDLVFAAFEHRLVVDLDEFVHVAEAGGCLGCRDGVADAVAVDARTLALQVRDQVFIEAVGRKDLAFGEAVLVEDPADFLREIGEVTAVEPDAVAVGIAVVDAVLLEGADGVQHAAAEGVIRVDEEDEILTPVRLDIVAESLVLAFYAAAVGGDKAVGHRTGGRNAVERAGNNVGRAGAAGDDGGFCAVYGCPRTVGPA